MIELTQWRQVRHGRALARPTGRGLGWFSWIPLHARIPTVRVAPWSNRAGDPLGELLHYDRRIVGGTGCAHGGHDRRPAPRHRRRTWAGVDGKRPRSGSEARWSRIASGRARVRNPSSRTPHDASPRRSRRRSFSEARRSPAGRSRCAKRAGSHASCAMRRRRRGG